MRGRGQWAAAGDHTQSGTARRTECARNTRLEAGDSSDWLAPSTDHRRQFGRPLIISVLPLDRSTNLRRACCARIDGRIAVRPLWTAHRTGNRRGSQTNGGSLRNQRQMQARTRSQRQLRAHAPPRSMRAARRPQSPGFSRTWAAARARRAREAPCFSSSRSRGQSER